MKLLAVALLILAHLAGPGLADAPGIPWTRYQCGIAPDKIKVAMRKMGPQYDYRLEGPVLRVSTDGGKPWKRLKY